MADYVDASTQTRWAGLMQRESVRPETLLSAPPDPTTPPEDMMLTEKSQFMYGGVVPSIAPPQDYSASSTPATSSSLLERRKNRAGLDAYIEMPAASHPLNADESPYSPPATRAMLSPIPEANKRHAGHTPLIPRSLSPEHDAMDAFAQQVNELAGSLFKQSGPADQHAVDNGDEGLKGALTLPTNPTDGSQDENHIGLDTLDEVLGQIAKQQTSMRDEADPDAKQGPRMDSVQVGEEILPLSRKGSADSRRSVAADEVDGVLLKQPPTNFGAPLGQLYSN
jgi:hypothetical protein